MGVASGRELFELIPDPYRGWLDARRARRWVRAVRFERTHNATLPANAKSVSFYPMRLEPSAALAHVLARLGVRIAPFGTEATLTAAWHTGTWISPRDIGRLPDDALNRACVDIAKDTVDRMWAETAGYSIAVDPLTWRGPMVVKPLENAVRGGHLVDGPLPSRRTDVVYQRLVDSRTADGRIHSTRAMIGGGRVFFGYEKWRPYPNWFAGQKLSLPAAADELYSAPEQQLLVRLAQVIGLEFGEIDVVRDNESGLIYAVDANRTPVRPRSLPADCDDEVFAPMSAAFARLLERV